MSQERVVHLSGHVGDEVEHHAVVDARPFRMRAWQHDQRPRRLRRHRAEELGLLAAHDVGRFRGIARRQARNDHELAALGLDQPVRQAIERRGTGDVRRFAPSLAAADHAAGDARHRVVAPVAHEPVERRRERQPVETLDAERPVADVEHAAAGAEPVGACAGRAPVEGDQGGGHPARRRATRPARSFGGRTRARRKPAWSAPRAGWVKRSGRFYVAGADQRPAASSSAMRASTQRSPWGVRSFFHNGARVLR